MCTGTPMPRRCLPERVEAATGMGEQRTLHQYFVVSFPVFINADFRTRARPYQWRAAYVETFYHNFPLSLAALLYNHAECSTRAPPIPLVRRVAERRSGRHGVGELCSSAVGSRPFVRFRRAL
jgi:hypothetical protein